MTTLESKTEILVWDAPTRLFHWLLAVCFSGAYLTAESDRLMAIHLTLGYTMVGLVAFRVVWGVIGTRHARFTSFLRGPAAVARYVSQHFSAQAEHSVGHNPLGAVSIVLMLLMTLAIVVSGWIYDTGGSHLLKEFHEGAAAFMLAVVGVHVAGVMFASLLQRENLVRSMFNGYQRGRAEQAIRWTWWPVAVVMLAAVLGYWFLQWQNPPVDNMAGDNFQNQNFYENLGKNAGHRNNEDEDD